MNLMKAPLVVIELLFISHFDFHTSLQWRYYGRDGVSNHQPHHCVLNRLFRRKSKKTSKFRVTGICAGNSPVTGKFPAQISMYVYVTHNYYSLFHRSVLYLTNFTIIALPEIYIYKQINICPHESCRVEYIVFQYMYMYISS